MRTAADTTRARCCAGRPARRSRSGRSDHASGRHYVVRCQYLLGADGGRQVASLIGVSYEGLGVVTQTATLHVSADFSPWAGIRTC